MMRSAYMSGWKPITVPRKVGATTYARTVRVFSCGSAESITTLSRWLPLLARALAAFQTAVTNTMAQSTYRLR